MKTIGIAIITHRAKNHLNYCLPHWLNSPMKPRVLVVNSSSNDGTVEMAQKLGAETLIIPRHEFNHGSTRERARQYLKSDVVVMTTPDAYPIDQQVLEQLVKPIFSGQAVVAYARQIAHDGADFFETFPRSFNYPKESHIRSIGDVEKYGVYTFFSSDSCCAYLNSALDEVGGFTSVLTGEDTVAAAKLLHNNCKIAYVAEAIVKHSHRYTWLQEFCRHFDTGLARKQYQDLLSIAGKDSQRGKQYVRDLLATLWKENPLLIPQAITHIIAKWLGYRIGQASVHAPLWWKKSLSSQDFYWKR